ncbi:sperm-associated antigen 1-like [Tripterygium wilfordii]|uniref:sperm-associated antigen 1-like n=1 Tax=Tripterygium wilfordii TaxID=458696 RepID=UPI0018F84C5E|nr:sperm-associated antigen 1-like [Tripterygium wilfordii]
MYGKLVIYHEALSFYTDALFMAKTRAQKIALHSNRAACYLKLHEFKKAAEECTSVLELDHKHTGALMLGAQTLVALKEYHSALFDVNRLMELNPSSEVYQNLEARLRTQLSLPPIPESEAELDEEQEDDAVKNKDGKDLQDGAVSIEDSQNVKPDNAMISAEVIVPRAPIIKESFKQGRDQKPEPEKISVTKVVSPQAQKTKESSEQKSKGWQAIPKPKGHSALDYARWDRVEDDSSDEDDDDDDEEESQPQYRFRVRTVGVQPVK